MPAGDLGFFFGFSEVRGEMRRKREICKDSAESRIVCLCVRENVCACVWEEIVGGTSVREVRHCPTLLYLRPLLGAPECTRAKSTDTVLEHSRFKAESGPQCLY